MKALEMRKKDSTPPRTPKRKEKNKSKK